MELSGGEQQRVAVARALAGEPRIVWADEPTGNLDSEMAASVIALLGELHAEGLTIVLVTHDPTVAAHADRLITVRDGRLVEDELLGAPVEKEVREGVRVA
jgi:putative ABC transport system ATP-binding protein